MFPNVLEIFPLRFPADVGQRGSDKARSTSPSTVSNRFWTTNHQHVLECHPPPKYPRKQLPGAPPPPSDKARGRKDEAEMFAGDITKDNNGVPPTSCCEHGEEDFPKANLWKIKIHVVGRHVPSGQGRGHPPTPSARDTRLAKQTTEARM